MKLRENFDDIYYFLLNVWLLVSLGYNVDTKHLISEKSVNVTVAGYQTTDALKKTYFHKMKWVFMIYCPKKISK